MLDHRRKDTVDLWHMDIEAAPPENGELEKRPGQIHVSPPSMGIGYLAKKWSGKRNEGIAANLPGVKIFGTEVEVPDMKWIWEVFRISISFQS